VIPEAGQTRAGGEVAGGRAHPRRCRGHAGRRRDRVAGPCVAGDQRQGWPRERLGLQRRRSRARGCRRAGAAAQGAPAPRGGAPRRASAPGGVAGARGAHSSRRGGRRAPRGSRSGSRWRRAIRSDSWLRRGGVRARPARHAPGADSCRRASGCAASGPRTAARLPRAREGRTRALAAPRRTSSPRHWGPTAGRRSSPAAAAGR
jgi:hypothetical protein